MITFYISEADENMAKYESIVYISKLLQDGTINDLSKKISTAERTAADISKRLAELESARIAKRAEAERLARETAAAEEAAKVQQNTAQNAGIEISTNIKNQTSTTIKQYRLGCGSVRYSLFCMIAFDALLSYRPSNRHHTPNC